MPVPIHDRNLLVGVVALQMDFVSRDDLIAAINAWAIEKSRLLSDLLLQRGVINHEERQLLELMADRQLARHSDDIEKSLAAAGPDLLATLTLSLDQLSDDNMRCEVARLTEAASRCCVSATNQSSQPEGRQPSDRSPPSSDPSTSAPLPGDGKSGRFRIVRPHAKGGLGEVLIARDKELGRDVALKQIQSRYARHAESRARFVREAEITGSLEHPGVVPVYALGTYDDGRPYYAMRLIQGESLSDAIRAFHSQSFATSAARLVELRKLLRRFLDVCNAMDYAHSRGVLHRDLKPGNVMLGKFGETLVVDWGLAKAKGQGPCSADADHTRLSDSCDVNQTQAGARLGTPAYMSPEQAAGQYESLGPASDVYSLGATLYAILVGAAPFREADSVDALLADVRSGRYPSPQSMQPWLPRPLCAICQKAMALMPQDRYSSCGALAADMEAWMADVPITALKESPMQRLARMGRRHRTAVAAAFIVLFTAVVALAVNRVLVGMEKSRTEKALGKMTAAEAAAEEQRVLAEQRAEAELQARRLADRNEYLARISLAQQAWQSGSVVQLTSILERIAPKPGEPDPRGFEYFHLWKLLDDNIVTLSGHEGAIAYCDLSPDGRLVATAGWDDHRLMVWDRGSGECLWRKALPQAVNSVAFTRDGRFVIVGEESAISVWDAASHKEFQRIEGTVSKPRSVAVSDDGTYVAFASVDDGVCVLDCRSWQVASPKALVADPIPGGLWTVKFRPETHVLAMAGGPFIGAGTVRFWDLDADQDRGQVQGHLSAITAIAFSADGERLWTGSGDRSVEEWDLESRKQKGEFRGHSGSVTAICPSQDGKRMYTAGSDRTIRVWSIPDRRQVDVWKGHAGVVTHLALAANGDYLVSSSADGTARVWNPEVRRGYSTLDPKKSALPNLLGLLAGFALPKELVDRLDISLTLDFSVDSKLLLQNSVSLASGGTIRLWDIGRRTSLAERRAPPGYFFTAAVLSIDGRTVYAAEAAMADLALALQGRQKGFGSMRIVAWSPQEATYRPLTDKMNEVTFDLAVHPDGSMLAAATSSGRILLWRTSDGGQDKALTTNAGYPFSIGFRRAGDYLASASHTGRIHVFDVRSGKRIAEFGDAESAHGIDFSPNGDLLAVGGGYTDEKLRSSGLVNVWDWQAGRKRASFEGHAMFVRSVVFSPRGDRLLSVGLDGNAKLWDMDTGYELLGLKSPGIFCAAGAMSSDGRTIALADEEGRIYFWEAAR